jgi:hypothetical protein
MIDWSQLGVRIGVSPLLVKIKVRGAFRDAGIALATAALAFAASRLAAPLEPVHARPWLKMARG